MPAEVHVRGLRELQRAFALAEKDARTFVRAELRNVAEPIRSEAESLASARITRIGPRWSLMRTGVTRTSIYVAPRQKGTRGRGDRRRARPNLAGLLMDRAMEPALEHHAADVSARVEHALDRMADHFNRGGTIAA